MIPILFNNSETQFTTQGLGALADAVSCVVTEERNGIYELEMVYPQTGIHFEDIQERNIILAIPSPYRSAQPFRIYKITKPLNGNVTVYANHISYDLNGIPVNPFSASSPAAAMSGLENNAAIQNNFIFWTDKGGGAEFKLSVPTACRSCLGGMEGSILDVYGGEYLWDFFTVRLYNQRGNDSGVVIRYGKNLTGLTQESDISNTVTGIYPYWYQEDAGLVVCDPPIIYADNAPFQKAVPVDFTSDFEDQPSPAQLQQVAEDYIERNDIGKISVSLTVNFLNLEQMSGYENLRLLEACDLCDTVTVQYEAAGIDVDAKIVSITTDVLLERYDQIEVGSIRANIAQTIADQQQQIDRAPTTSYLQQAVSNATKWITGGKGGYVIFQLNANGQPEEILIMDQPSIETARKVWRWNQGGLGYSSNGYNGPYTTAITQDGSIVADFITSGTMLANIIKGGILLMGGQANGNGVIEMRDASGNLIGRWDNAGIMALAGTFAGALQGATGTFSGDISGANGIFTGGIKTSNAEITGGLINIETANSQENIITLQYEVAYSRMGAGFVKTEDDTGAGQATGSFISYPTVEGANVYVTNYFQDNGSARIIGNLDVSGTKNRRVKTENYGETLLYSYEMARPYFGDIGTGKLDNGGVCFIALDEKFRETVDSQYEYIVTLQPEGDGIAYVSKKAPDGFTVIGTPGVKFAWEIKARQKDQPYRLEKPDEPPEKRLNYEYITEHYMSSLRRDYFADYAAEIKDNKKEAERKWLWYPVLW